MTHAKSISSRFSIPGSIGDSVNAGMVLICSIGVSVVARTVAADSINGSVVLDSVVLDSVVATLLATDAIDTNAVLARKKWL
ncbi:MAG: hypothetical protein HQM06_16420 [Magnetococcales bacterium]|nr:hypothetical protein [Magnetococcales bacterium]